MTEFIFKVGMNAARPYQCEEFEGGLGQPLLPHLSKPGYTFTLIYNANLVSLGKYEYLQVSIRSEATFCNSMALVTSHDMKLF